MNLLQDAESANPVSVKSCSSRIGRSLGIWLWVAWCAALIAIFWLPLYRLAKESLSAGYSSQAILMPLAAAFLIWADRKRIFDLPAVYPALAAKIAAAAIPLLWLSIQWPYGRRSLILLTVILLMAAGLAGLFGIVAVRRSFFPLSLLLFFAPLPDFLVNRVLYFLQVGSADLTYAIFWALGLPVYQEGFRIMLPQVTLEVAKECSGINSSIALLLTILVIAHQTLESSWRQALLLLLTIPLSIFKNAVRIVCLTLLAIWVDPGFLKGNLHQQGGIVFFLLALAALFPIWKFLRKGETVPKRFEPQRESGMG